MKRKSDSILNKFLTVLLITLFCFWSCDILVRGNPHNVLGAGIVLSIDSLQFLSNVFY